MNLDDAMIAKLLQSYGAPMTANNAALARNFFANNPEIAEKRAMGLRGSGLDDNSDVFGPQLEKFIAKTDLPPRNAAETYSAPEQEQAAPTKAPVRQAAPSRQGNYGPATDTATKQNKDYGPGTGPTEGDSDWWKWLLGIGAGATSAALVRKGMEVPRPPEGYPGTPESGMKPGPLAETAKNFMLTDPRIPESRRLTFDDSQVKTITNDPKLTEQGRINQLKAEIDAENEKLRVEEADKQRLLEEIQRRQEIQRNTEATARAGKESQTPRLRRPLK